MIPLEAIEHDRSVFEKAVSQVTPEILGSIIDHTLLSPTATQKDVERLCNEANSIGSFICVNGSRINDAKNFIQERRLEHVRGIAAVIGFPFGAELTREKEAGALGVLVDEKADGVEMVLNIGKFRDGSYEEVEDDIRRVARMVKTASNLSGHSKILKVIQENCVLTDPEKEQATRLTCLIGAETRIHIFAKTSTTLGIPKDEKTPRGATIQDVWNMSWVIDEVRKASKWPHIGVKAAGGIGDGETAIKMMLAGGCFDDNLKLKSGLSDIFRIGASSGKKVVLDFANRYA